MPQGRQSQGHEYFEYFLQPSVIEWQKAQSNLSCYGPERDEGTANLFMVRP